MAAEILCYFFLPSLKPTTENNSKMSSLRMSMMKHQHVWK